MCRCVCACCMYVDTLVKSVNGLPCGHREGEGRCETNCFCKVRASVCVCVCEKKFLQELTVSNLFFAEAPSVLRGPGWAAEVGAAGRMAAAMVGGWGHHTAVTCFSTRCTHNFTLGEGHWDASLNHATMMRGHRRISPQHSLGLGE